MGNNIMATIKRNSTIVATEISKDICTAYGVSISSEPIDIAKIDVSPSDLGLSAGDNSEALSCAVAPGNTGPSSLC